MCFSENITKSLWTVFYIEQSRWLLLNVLDKVCLLKGRKDTLSEYSWNTNLTLISQCIITLNSVLGKFPPGQFPPSESPRINSPGKLPPGELPPGQIPHGKLPPTPVNSLLVKFPNPNPTPNPDPGGGNSPGENLPGGRRICPGGNSPGVTYPGGIWWGNWPGKIFQTPLHSN